MRDAAGKISSFRINLKMVQKNDKKPQAFTKLADALQAMLVGQNAGDFDKG